jgi:hypothetical protein
MTQRARLEMKVRAALAVVVTVAFGAACSAHDAVVGRAVGTPRAGSVPHRDMARDVKQLNSCDYAYPPPTLRQMVATVGRDEGFARAAVLVRVLGVGAPRWNTQDGRLPSQAQADAMTDRLGLQPDIFRPIALDVLHVYAGAAVAGPLTAFAETGKIGEYENNSCAFGSSTTLQIRDGPDVVSVGGTYVAFLGHELTTGSSGGPLAQPVIQDVYVVRSDAVIDLAGSPEPLPGL